VSAWKPIVGFAPSKESSSLIVPLQWENGYNESLTLIWMPLPLQIRYLLFSNDYQWISTEVALFGLNYSRSQDYNWRPSASLGWKRKISDALGYETKLFYQGEVKRGDDEPYSRTISLQIGGFIQITSWLGINPSISIWNESGAVRSQYLGEIPMSLKGEEAKNTHWRFPLNLSLVARFSASSEIQAEIRYYRFGFESTYTEIPIFLTFVHYW
jgi:hypothetical protein